MKFFALFVLVACSSPKDFPPPSQVDAKVYADAPRPVDSAEVFARRCSTVQVNSSFIVGGFECATPADAVGATAVFSYIDSDTMMEVDPMLGFTIMCGPPGTLENQVLTITTFPGEKLKEIIVDNDIVPCQ